MPKGDKYIDLTRYLQTCDLDEIEMSFQQVAEIVGGLPPSAYQYAAYWSDGSQGSFSFGWLNAGYSARAQLDRQIVCFTKMAFLSSRIPVPSSKKTLKHRDAKASAGSRSTLDIGLAIKKTRKYHATIKDAQHTRYRSWEHCYRAFSSCSDNPDEVHIEYLCLHLAWYLASWGMLRNSFLMNHDHLIHTPLLRKLLTTHFRPLFIDAQTEKSIPLTLEAADVIQTSYPVQSVTDTLITKILLGIFGSAPAYDRFFKDAARKYSVCTGVFGEKSLKQLWQYYQEHVIDFEDVRKRLSCGGTQYTPMKVLDMCLWQIGYDDADHRLDESM
ncbi:hypothetical protein LJC27_02980 [Christensenellaceae bacterium OttesenSCG-928-M15]|nr:hypothetical protein [Christensenellaceae bacterium OttesenSCG-928-M15]